MADMKSKEPKDSDAQNAKANANVGTSTGANAKMLQNTYKIGSFLAFAGMDKELIEVEIKKSKELFSGAGEHSEKLSNAVVEILEKKGEHIKTWRHIKKYLGENIFSSDTNLGELVNEFASHGFDILEEEIMLTHLDESNCSVFKPLASEIVAITREIEKSKEYKEFQDAKERIKIIASASSAGIIIPLESYDTSINKIGETAEPLLNKIAKIMETSDLEKLVTIINQTTIRQFDTHAKYALDKLKFVIGTITEVLSESNAYATKEKLEKLLSRFKRL